MGLDERAVQQRRRELRLAVKLLQQRCLHQAATWAAEQLCGLPPDHAQWAPPPASHTQPPTTTAAAAPATSGDAGFGSSGVGSGRGGEGPGCATTAAVELEEVRRGDAGASSGPGVDAAEGGRSVAGQEWEQEVETDAVVLGRLYLGGKEYRRAAHVLRDEKGKLAFFLRCYALFLAGEKRKEEEAVEASAAQPGKAVKAANAELPQLQQELQAQDEAEELDAFGLFLLGMVLVRRDAKDAALDKLCRSVKLFPWNWSAWMEIQTLCTDHAKFAALAARLAPHWMRSFWEASTLIDLHQNAEGLTRCTELSAQFPGSCHLVAQTATAHYNLRDFDSAEEAFEGLFQVDPFRIEGVDTYSNILYVRENFAALSYLAHKVVLIDKYRPETCCVVGNYFSLKGRHERAVVYFRRALKLNPAYLSAWTLMGHEYVEMKNTPAAIDAYRTAVDINPKDYRAWYGLGQTYEILAMPYYALYYYRKATQLRPSDARMWCAMGQCYESAQLRQHAGAIRCYEQAVAHGDREGIALAKLARLHDGMGNSDKAAHYFRKNLERLEEQQVGGGPELVEALLFLANYHRSNGALQQAEQYCSRLLDFSGPAKEEAKAILREIRSVHQHHQLQHPLRQQQQQQQQPYQQQLQQQQQLLQPPQLHHTPLQQWPSPDPEQPASSEEFGTEYEDEEFEDDESMDMADTP